jgi:RecA/RadA recombinase
MLTSRGVDAERIAVFPVATVEDFRHQCIQIVDNYRELPREDQKPMLIVLDSLGMLSTTKEMKDTAEGKDVRDMTRAQVVKSTFRTLTLKLGEAGIPLIMTNHTYKVVGAYVPMSEMGGGTGLKYAASTIVYLTKKKVKEGTDVVGNIIHCKLYKGRLTKENSVVDVLLNYESGVNPYYGLLDIALKYGIVKKSTTRYEFPDGSKAFEKAIYKDPDKYFTEDIMKQIDEACKKEFLYGTSVDDDTTSTLELESE